MARLLTLQCDICGFTATEQRAGDGVHGWCGITGLGKSGEATLCPEHARMVAGFLDTLEDDANG